MQRENVPEYSTNVLREGITNTVMHRDWFLEGANVFVNLYAVGVEVVSPGSLPQDLSLTDLGGKNVQN